MSLIWHFPHYRNGIMAASGDMAKNFRNENSETIDADVFTDVDAEFGELRDPPRYFAREFTQNAVDANADPEFQRLYPGQQLHLEFRFEYLVGPARSAFIAAAGLESLAGRLEHIPDDAAARSLDSCLNHLSDDRPLSVLYVTERGASGMYGPWDEALGISKLTIAMLSHNVSEKPSDAGGGYGKGKSVNALASRARVNIAYTKFPKYIVTPNDGASRRLLGVAYWPKHDGPDGRACQGHGFLHKPISVGLETGSEHDAANPWVDEEADEIAEKLGFEIRTGDSPESFGTSLMILDPHFDARELKEALERYWWPAMIDDKLLVSIRDADGVDIEVRPNKNPALRPFIRCFDAMATGSASPEIEVVETSEHSRLRVPGGSLALTQRAEGGNGESQGSVVALMRGLGMVVQYRGVAVSSPAIVGVFQANKDHDVQRLLKMSEPALHNKWVPKHEEADPSVADNIRLLVQGIHRSISEECRKLSNKLAPEQLDDATRIDALNKHLSALLEGGGGEVPPGEERDFSITRHRPTLEVVDSNLIRASGQVDFEQLVDFDVEEGNDQLVEVKIRYFLPDDANRRHAPIPIKLTTISGVEKERVGDPGQIDLIVSSDGKGSDFKIRWETEPYSRLFVGDLDVEVGKSKSTGVIADGS